MYFAFSAVPRRLPPKRGVGGATEPGASNTRAWRDGVHSTPNQKRCCWVWDERLGCGTTDTGMSASTIHGSRFDPCSQTNNVKYA